MPGDTRALAATRGPVLVSMSDVSVVAPSAAANAEFARHASRTAGDTSVRSQHHQIRQPIRVSERRRTQHQCIDDGEHARRQAHTEREHAGRREHHRRTRAQTSVGVFKVVDQCHRRPPPHLPRGLHDHDDVAKIVARAVPRVVARFASIHSQLHFLVEVKPDLGVQIRVRRAAAEESREPGHAHAPTPDP